MKRHPETWHLLKVLEYLESPNVRTEDEICKYAVLHHNKLKSYLKKLMKLKMVVKVKNDGLLTEKRNGMAILWQSTDIGQDFKYVIRRYVKA